tara:strand:- start:949 stop:1497 length:549 start_codon:yes stop_codon:yes gene_type:complete
MPRGLKETSSQITVSFRLTESAPNTFTTERIDLQLNALDNEVFVVTGVKLDVEAPDLIMGPGAGSVRTGVFASVSKQDVSAGIADLGNPSVFATSSLVICGDDAIQPGGDFAYSNVGFIENDVDTPQNMEYLDVIATPDFYVNIDGSHNSSEKSVAGKLYGYRARADSSTYAALVQSELLSS